MTRDQLIASCDQYIAEHGPWTGHRIHLGEGVYTCEDVPQYCLSSRMSRYLQILDDFNYESFTRILDLGCHEGFFSIEFARRTGATVLGVDGREANIDRARWAACTIGVHGPAFFEVGDVRNLQTKERFDVVLCVGILYHLTAEDVFKLLNQPVIREAELLIIETHTAPLDLAGNQFAAQLSDWATYFDEGIPYVGRWYSEFPSTRLTAQEKLDYSTGSALDNDESFWFAPDDLRRVVERVGWRVYEAAREVDSVVLVGRR